LEGAGRLEAKKIMQITCNFSENLIERQETLSPVAGILQGRACHFRGWERFLQVRCRGGCASRPLSRLDIFALLDEEKHRACIKSLSCRTWRS
jgi:hypothetical protein